MSHKAGYFGAGSAPAAIGIGVLVLLIGCGRASSPEARRRLECQSNLKVIAAAIEKYAAEHGGQWPKDIVADDGRPLLSWRVRILEQLGYPDLYSRFDLQQSWDSSVNCAAVTMRPDVYRCPTASKILTDNPERVTTNYFLVQSADGTVSVREIGQLFVTWTRPTALSAAEFATIERIANSMHPNWNNYESCTSQSATRVGCGSE